MSVFSRFRGQLWRTESENENRQILKRQRKECRKTLKVSLTKDPYMCLRFACSKNYVLLINHLLAHLDSMGVGVEEYGTERSPLRVVVISGNVEAAAALLDNRHISAFPTFPLALSECAIGTDMAMLRTLLFSSGGESRLLQAHHSLGRVPPIEKAFKMAIEAKKYDHATVLIEALLQSGDSTYLNTCKANNGEPLVDEALRVLLTTHSGLPVNQAWQDLGKLLAQKGANVNAITDGSSVLHTVIARELYDKAIFLLDEDADVNLQSRSGNTPIFDLIVNLCKSLDDGRHTKTPAKSEDHLLVRSILSHGARLDIQNEDGDTPLYPAVRSQNYTLLEILLNEAHDIASVNRCGETVFSIATAKADCQCMEMLIEKDTTLLNKTGTGKRAPLMTAVEGKLGRTARWLLDAGALTDLIDSEGNTALHYAAAHKDTAIVDMLLNAGASSAIRNNTDWYPVHCAAKAGSFATYERIINSNASIVHGEYLLGLFILTMAPDTGNIEILRDVMRFKPNVNFILDDSGATALHMCIDRGMEVHARLLLENSADPNLQNHSGLAPLDLAVTKKLWELAKLLVEKGADPNYSGLSDTRPINIACFEGQRDLVVQLINKGTFIQTLRLDSPNPLMSAVYGQSSDIVQLLLDCGVAADTFDVKTHISAVEAAKRIRNSHIERILRERIANPTNYRSSREFMERLKNPGAPLNSGSVTRPPVSPISNSLSHPAKRIVGEDGSPFFKSSISPKLNNATSPLLPTTTIAPRSPYNSVPARQSFALAQSSRDDMDIEPDLGMLGEIFSMASQLGPMLENPQPTLINLRNSSAAQLRKQSRAKIELLNNFIYEVNPWDKEQLLDKLNGVGVRILLDL